MITVEIPKRDLLRQLPEKAGYALMQWFDQMPSTFRFEALPVATEREIVQQAFPALWEVLTPTEHAFLTALYRRGRVSYTTLFAALRVGSDGRAFEASSNILAVQIKCLRKKLQGRPERLYVQTYKQGVGQPGAYELIQAPEDAEVPSGRVHPFISRKHYEPRPEHLRGKRTCSQCRKLGHNSRTCPNPNPMPSLQHESSNNRDI